jgi:O-antigen/teichoic acid export membrane protein
MIENEIDDGIATLEKAPEAPSSSDGSRPGLARRTMRAASWAAAESMGGQCISFVVFLVMARLLTPADFGAVALANIYVAFSQVLIFQGLGQAIVQKAELSPEDLEAAFWINLSFGLVIAVVTLPLGGPVAQWFHSPGLAGLMRWLSPIFVLSALADVQTNLLAREFAYKSLAVRTIVAFSFGGLVGIFMARAGYGIWSLVGQQLTVAVFNVALLWTASPWRPRLRFSGSHAWTMWHFSSRLMGHEFVSLGSRRSDLFFVGKYLNTVAAGTYAVAARVSTLLNEIVVRSLSRVSLASLARLQGEPGGMGGAFSRIMQMQSCLIFPAAAALSFFAREVVLVTVGPHWVAAVPAMRVLLLAIPLEALSALNAAAIIARGRPGWVSMLTCVHAGLNVMLFAIVARWGIVAVATAYLIRATLLYPVELAVLRRLIPVTISQICESCLPPLIAVVAMTAADTFIRAWLPVGFPPILLLLTGLPASVAIYGGVLAIMRRDLIYSTWSELKMLRA